MLELFCSFFCLAQSRGIFPYTNYEFYSRYPESPKVTASWFFYDKVDRLRHATINIVKSRRGHETRRDDDVKCRSAAVSGWLECAVECSRPDTGCLEQRLELSVDSVILLFYYCFMNINIPPICLNVFFFSKTFCPRVYARPHAVQSFLASSRPLWQ